MKNTSNDLLENIVDDLLKVRKRDDLQQPEPKQLLQF
jgi:hypothetical protein